MKVALAAASPLLAVILWVAALAVDPGPIDPWSVFLIGVGLLGAATASVVGVVVVGGRWARRTALVTLGYTLLIAVIRPIDSWWLVALLATLASIALYLLPVVSRGVRRLPAATGPPGRAVVLPLVLLGSPAILGLASWQGPTAATMVVALTAPLAALWYSRVLPGGLLGVRLVWPLLALVLAAFQPRLAVVATVVLAVMVLIIAWHHEVKVAFHPPRETGSVFPIPPELAPPEVLDAAGLDEHGERR